MSVSPRPTVTLFPLGGAIEGACAADWLGAGTGRGAAGAAEVVGAATGGVVLVGGGAKLPGLTDLVKQEMKLAAQIGFTLSDEWEGRGGGFKEYLEDPEFVSAFGLVLWDMDSEGRGGDGTPSGVGFKKFFRYFAP